MEIAVLFDISAPPTQYATSFDCQCQNGGNIVVTNMSHFNVIIKFANGLVSYVPSNDRRRYFFYGVMAQPNSVVQWAIQSDTGLPQTVNRFVVEMYSPGELVPETYPAPMIRNVQVAH